MFSGLVIGKLGMGWALYGGVAPVGAAFVHLRTIHIDEPEPVPSDDGASRVDIRGALEAINAVPGLLMLIFGVLSMAFIAGGLIVAKVGLGSRPARVVLACNLVNWVVCATFTLRSSIVWLVAGMLVWLTLIPIVEAAEQTVLQRSVPLERQGRVFGFAQLVENAASPLTAIFIGPIAEAFVMPTMTDGRGADWIGGWFGTGPDRGLALIFTVAGVLGIAVTGIVRFSRSYRHLVAIPSDPEPAATDPDAAEDAAELAVA